MTAIEIVVGSGFAPGLADGSTSIALFDVAGMTMQICSSDPCGDAFRVIGVFERSLRLLIAAKLQKIAGPKWFKQRIDGILVSKARENRETALRNGEQERDLLSYLDLGDLVRIVLQKRIGMRFLDTYSQIKIDLNLIFRRWSHIGDQ